MGSAAPVAVVGLSCRLPHAPDPAAFWRLLRLGESAVTTMPSDRVRAPAGGGPARSWPGGFLDDVASFDADFFGISPREAVAMDPQQRLMLELTWEALEDAGIRPPSLAGSDTGVFVSAIWDDYAAVLRRSDLDGSARHAMTGVHRSIIANRVSHKFDLRGPSLHIDTAQSSSLVAVHTAAESLRRGECSVALAGGVNLILAEDSMEMAERFGGLSPDGLCHTFDARANGFVRGEGGGAVVLKPLAAALRDGDPVYCVILGGAVNNDGNTDALTVPSPAAQERVLREAYRAADVPISDVQYVELHGSGTPVGDPVEAAALGAVIGADRPAGAPLPVGSVKTNLGHLEGAGGVAGLIKTALSLRHGELPPSLNFRSPNPRIPLDRLGLRVQDRLTGWPNPDRPLLAGVSSFGMGGTNCHLVLAQAPEPVADEPPPATTAEDDIPWALSAASPEALSAQAGRLRRHLANRPGESSVDVGYSLGTTRSAFGHRAVVFGADIEERLDRLAVLETGDGDPAGLVLGREGDGRVAVLLGGEAGLRAGMGRSLYATHPCFAEALDEVWAALDHHLDRPVSEVAFAEDGPLDQSPYAEAATFALDVALYRLAASWGLDTDHVVGHGAGDIAAAHVTGSLSLADACERVVSGSQDARESLDARLAALPDAEVVLVLGPDEPLAALAREHLATRTGTDRPEPFVVEALRSDRPETVTFAAAMAELHVRGTDLDWEKVFAGRGGRRVALPTYAFQRSRYWPVAAPEPRIEVARVPPPPPPDSPFTRRLAELDGPDRDRLLLETVLADVANVLGHATPAAVDPGLTFKQLGFDSIAGTELAQRLGAATGLSLATTLTFDHPTPNAVVGHLSERALHAPAAAPLQNGRALADDPVVIVGMACRFPGGVESPEELWDLVAGGVDAVGEFPGNRSWDLGGLFDGDTAHSGRSHARSGGFLHDADLFDAGFFGISPREALAMDPQQRLLLETAWQAFERAGIDAGSLRSSPTGVFVGATTQDYGPRMHEPSRDLDGQVLTGTAPSVMAGRVAFTFGLEGPAMTVDTACSSSLVAMHLASQSLRQGECTLALAGGVTVMATPGMFVEFSRQRGLSADGRCKAFSASADGTGWAEGVGLVVLERLSDAQRNGHRVLAVVRGSAINQDGASNGLTAPNGPSQERVIGAALANAGLTTSDIDVVEAHGTGTALGDPIEANALLATYGKGRSEDRPLWLGSVKSNLGHTQAAAGVAGVIKMVMAMRNGMFPATLHVDEPSPHVDWSSGGVRLLTEPVDWSQNGHPRRAGVSSFGISGTNAHLILEAAPDVRATEQEIGPWVVSAKSPEALRAQAERLAEHLTARPGLTPGEVGWSLIRTRAVFEYRAVVLGDDRNRLLAELTALADDRPDADVVTGVAGTAGPGPVLVFPGQGSQWVGMGAELLDESPVFAARMAECEQALAPHVDWSLIEVIRSDGSELSRVDVVQPVLWAVMVSLAAVWADYGVKPAAVVGHSQGEIAAACVAGALSIEDAARVVAVRSRVLRRLAGGGAMASLGVGAEQAEALLGDGVTVAAVNGPMSTVISGPPEPVAAVVAAAREQGLRARMIDVDYASHGPQVDEITGELTEALAGITASAAPVPFYSTVTGRRIDTASLDTGYWVTNLRRPVRFADAVDTLLADGFRVFVESSPNPVLTMGIEECAERAEARAAALPTIRRDQGGSGQVLRALAGAFTAGVAVDWSRCFPADPAPAVVDLPTYAFQRARYWHASGNGAVDAADLGLGSTGHPVLGAAVEPVEGDGRALTGRVSRRRQPWLADHVIGGAMLVPGAAQLEMVLRAADEVGCAGVEELVLRSPLVVPEPDGLNVQVVVGAAGEDGRREVGVYSRAADGWIHHAAGVLRADPAVPGEPPKAWPPAGGEPVELGRFYEEAAVAGYGYGPGFQGMRAVWRDGAELFAEIDLPRGVDASGGFGVHPALLDAALHPLLLGRLHDEPGDGESGDGEPGDGGVWLPFIWSDVTLHAVGAETVRVRLSPLGDALDQGVRVNLTDPAGGPVLDAEVLLRRAHGERLREAAERVRSGTSGDADVVRRPSAASAPTGRGPDLADRLAALTADERRRTLLGLVRGHSAAVLGFPDPDEVRPDATFTELGLGSVMAVELRDRLSEASGLVLPTGLIFGHPTPQDVAAELLRRLRPEDTGRGRAVAGPPRGDEPGEDDDAVDRLRSASAEQVLDFIDNELGVS
ncbi:type I polyketide synthase [Actinomadura oligospora]|uniref:type I polyketide synthase n=1 Tax=Actinomadura oligospora TaxID=111804 RepID=UPI0004AE0D89|nr:type I polyketide synthase [Actinomadura oligospora]